MVCDVPYTYSDAAGAEELRKISRKDAKTAKEKCGQSALGTRIIAVAFLFAIHNSQFTTYGKNHIQVDDATAVGDRARRERAGVSAA